MVFRCKIDLRTHLDVKNDGEGNKGREHRGTPVADKRKRNPHNGGNPEGHANIDYNLRCKHSDKPDHYESSTRFTCASRNTNTTREEHDIKKQNKTSP